MKKYTAPVITSNTEEVFIMSAYDIDLLFETETLPRETNALRLAYFAYASRDMVHTAHATRDKEMAYRLCVPIEQIKQVRLELIGLGLIHEEEFEYMKPYVPTSSDPDALF